MTKTKNTRRALLISVLTMTLSFVMLIGTTFAWFTDTVSSGNNKIVAGNLDVEVTHTNNKVTNEALDKEGAKLFPVELWEPGVVSYETFTVKNAGSLAFNYTFNLTVADFNTVKDTDKSLKDVIKLGVLEGSVEGKTREQLVAAVKAVEAKEGSVAMNFTSFSDFGFEDYMEGEKSTKEFTIVAYWEPTENDDDYNMNGNKTVSKPNGEANQLYIDIVVNVVAKQRTYEEDSFNSDYDRVPGLILKGYAEAKTSDDLKQALAEGKNVVLTEDIEVDKSVLVAAEGTVIDGNGNKLIGLGTDNEHQGLQLAKNVEYRNVVFELEKGWGVITKSAKFYNCTFNAASPYLSPAEGDDIVVDGCTFVNTILQICYNEGGRKPESAKTIITNNKFIVNNTNDRAHAIAIGGGSPEFWAGGAETVTMTGNTFTPNYPETSYIAYYIYGDYGTTLTSVPVYSNNTYEGVANYSMNGIATENQTPLLSTEAEGLLYNESEDTYYVTNASGMTKELLVGGKNIKLFADIAVTNKLDPSDASFTLDGNGHIITQAENCTTNGVALFDITRGSAIIKNVTFDGIKDVAVIRTVYADLDMDNVTIENCKHTQTQGLVRLLGQSTITNSTFKNNNCKMVVTLNFDDKFNAPQVVKNCVFENNNCNDTAVLYYVAGAGATIDGNKFINNTVTSTGNAATVYMGFTENNVITNNLFSGNKVTTSHPTTKRATGGLMVGYEATITGNAFVNNTISVVGSDRILGNDVCASVRYTDIDLSGNYWGGNAPEAGNDYFVEYDQHEVIINDYLTSYDN